MILLRKITRKLDAYGRRFRKAPVPQLRDLYEIDRGTYGDPFVAHWGEPATLKIGLFCSIADGVTIFLGGEHRVGWIATYPFPALWESAKGTPGHPTTEEDVVIGHDV